MDRSRDPQQRDDVVALLEDPARAAAAEAAAARVDGTTLGLGSGRAVWATMELLGRREDLRGLRILSASSVTERVAGWHGFEVVTLDGTFRPALYLDGADEVGPGLGLLKGHGNALLREKLLAVAAERFVVIAERAKLVDRLGAQRTLPVEVVRFGWADTLRRLQADGAEVAVRMDGDEPLITDGGNHLLEVTIPPGADPAQLGSQLKATVGVIEHGLFLDLADEVLIGVEDGTVDRLTPATPKGDRS